MAGIYYTKQWLIMRRRILKRDGYRCVVCGTSLAGKKKSRVDHIVPVKDCPALAFEPTNLRSLCPSCDNKRHHEKTKAVPRKQVNLQGVPVGSDWVMDD
jgi:5-methylcytosine-specific restriction endonuclease McrA